MKFDSTRRIGGNFRFLIQWLITEACGCFLKSISKPRRGVRFSPGAFLFLGVDNET